MKEKIELYKIRDLGDRINVTFGFIRQNGKQLAKNLSYLMPVYIIGAIINGTYQGSVLSGSMYGYRSSDIGIMPVGIMLIGLVISLVSFIAILYVNSFVAEYEESEDGTVDDSKTWKRVWASFWGGFGGFILAGIVIGLGFIFCILPGIWLAVSFSLFIAAYVTERNKMVPGGVTDCLSESFNLIKQDWFGSFGYLFVVGIIALAFYIALSVPAMFSSVFVALLPHEQSLTMVFFVFSSLLYYIGALFVSAVSSVATILLYFELKERMQGLSVQKKIDNIGRGGL